MKRKVLLILTALSMLLSSIAYGQSDQFIEGSLPDSPVILNGVQMNPEYSEYPVLVYKGITYVPMTYNLSQSLGIQAAWSNDEGLNIMTTSSTGIIEEYVKSNRNSTVVAASKPDYRITVNETVIDNSKEEYPVLAYNGITYFPLTWRWVNDAFGWKMNYDQSSGLTINSSESGATRPIVMETDESRMDALNLLSEKINFVTDIKTFTLYAYLNHVGYDDENNRNGMHPVRKKVRSELESLNLDPKYKAYYDSKHYMYYGYLSEIWLMGNPPEFEYLGQSVEKPLSGFNQLLAEFYEDADIEKLYQKCLPDYQVELEKYENAVASPIVETLEYLKLDADESPEIYFQVNLLDAYYRGYGLGAYDVILGEGITIGPSDEPNVLNVVHEYLHGVINPITRDYYEKYGEPQIEFEKISDAYRSLESIINESFVRAVSGYIVKSGSDLESYIEQQESGGFIMTQYALNRFIEEYDSYDGGLEEFVHMLIRDYNEVNFVEVKTELQLEPNPEGDKNIYTQEYLQSLVDATPIDEEIAQFRNQRNPRRNGKLKMSGKYFDMYYPNGEGFQKVAELLEPHMDKVYMMLTDLYGYQAKVEVHLIDPTAVEMSEEGNIRYDEHITFIWVEESNDGINGVNNITEFVHEINHNFFEGESTTDTHIGAKNMWINEAHAKLVGSLYTYYLPEYADIDQFSFYENVWVQAEVLPTIIEAEDKHLVSRDGNAWDYYHRDTFENDAITAGLVFWWNVYNQNTLETFKEYLRQLDINEPSIGVMERITGLSKEELNDKYMIYRSQFN